MWEIRANQLLPKSCPKSNKSSNLVHWQCDQIRRHFSTLAKFKRLLAIFDGLNRIFGKFCFLWNFSPFKTWKTINHAIWSRRLCTTSISKSLVLYSKSYIVEHVFPGTIVSSDRHVLLVNDLCVVQILHGGVWGKDEGQATPHAVRCHLEIKTHV